MNVVVLRRRLFYISAMVLLLIPLYFLGNPSVRNQDGSVKSPGGTLAQLRTNYNLGQGDLGEIDPASESMRLATLGLRGVASTILWQKAEYYKREQFWDRFSATLNQIAILQPHFVKVWDFQSHNLAYNVSAEFDDYRQRYQWVKRGMDYLIKGGKYNKKRTELPFYLGWMFGNKLGVADEKKQFRELYRNDNNFHNEVLDKSGLDLAQPDGLGPDRKPDNWLSGRLWYERAYTMVDAGSKPAKSTMMFYREGPQWLMKHAEGIQSEGWLDEAARYAWRVAGRGWNDFGQIQILTSFGDQIRLKELQTANEEYKAAKEEFEEYCDEAYQAAIAERYQSLTAEEREAYEKPYLDRNFDEILAAEDADIKLSVDPDFLARQVADDKRVDAMERAAKLKMARDRIQHIEIYRNQINYAYWEARCEAEQEDAALLARTSMYEANQLLDKGELDGALAKYDVAWQAWDDLFNRFPSMMIDDAADEVADSVKRYQQLLDQPDLPDDFILNEFFEFKELFEEQSADPAMMSVIASWPVRYPGRNFLDEMLRKTRENPAPEMDLNGNSVEPTESTETPILEINASENKASDNTQSQASPGMQVGQPDEGKPPVPKS
ncbi:MAG: hypothetical protein KDB03_01390 [Planctomycetales bacterium]|nr:hypothetical protein [Planctomycetales bacterium]